MPFVQVYFDPEVSHKTLLRIREVLPRIVAANLTSDDDDDSEVLASDISVKFHQFGDYDVREQPLQIIVLANQYPTRVTNLDARAKQIARDLHEETAGAVPITNFYVWVLLAPSGFFAAKYSQEV